jgi:diaminopimelate epimerase
MEIRFTKMQGAGNDYIYVNCFEKAERDILLADEKFLEETIIKLSDRHFGIGGDGVVLILPSEVADAKMRMFNADGSEGKM